MSASKNGFLKMFLSPVIVLILITSVNAQNNPNVFEEYNVDEFSGKIWITAKDLPNEIEVKAYEDLDSVKVGFNFKRESNGSDEDELITYSELWIVMHGVVKEYDYEYEDGESCYEGLSKIYF